jgi:hypothetical protein
MASATFQFVPPSDEEKEKVTKNKLRLAEAKCNHTFSDIAILRFIRGHKGNEGKAYHFMEKHVHWRADENVDGIEVSSIENIIKKKTAVMYGSDKKGRPVINVLARRHNASDRDIAEIRRFIIYLLELTMSKTNPSEEQLTIVFDLHGFGMQCMDYESVKLLIEILQFNYPDVLGQAFIVNAPFIFWACWYAIKAWVDPVTVSKVVFCDRAQLAEHIDEAQMLPTIGTDECPDPDSILPSLTPATAPADVAAEPALESEPVVVTEPEATA